MVNKHLLLCREQRGQKSEGNLQSLIVIPWQRAKGEGQRKERKLEVRGRKSEVREPFVQKPNFPTILT
jgi:hypothetical protein